MADKQGQAEIRDLFIDKLVKGFADEELVFDRYVTSGATTAREIRWVQKTAGFLTSPTTSGMTTDLIETSEGSRPVVLAQSWTRNTSYVKIWKAETETIADEDIKDNMVDLLSTHLRDVVRAVSKKKNDHIYNVLTEDQTAVNINSFATTSIGGDQWDAANDAGDPIKDIEWAKKLIRDNNYEPTHLFLNPKDYHSLITWIYHKGAQAPSVGGQMVMNGVLSNVASLSVVVSNSVVTDSAVVCNPKEAVTYREFMPMKSATIEDPMIGIKVRVATEGIGLLTDPKAVCLITDTVS